MPGTGTDVVPYSLNTIRALHTCWHIPYNYIPEDRLEPGVRSIVFSPLPGDGNWKGEPSRFVSLLRGMELYNAKFYSQLIIVTDRDS